MEKGESREKKDKAYGFKGYPIILINILVLVLIAVFTAFYTRGFKQETVDWRLLLIVSGSMFLLTCFDIAVMFLINRKMQRAAIEAEQASKAKSDFLSNMSHEIRTPITAILGMNEIIQRESDDSNVLEYSNSIQKASVSLLGIISDILDFSKIEAGRMELEEEDYSLSTLISDLVNLTQLRAEAKGLKFETQIDPMLPKQLIGDELRVKQIITNLLSNAVKYTERGSVKLELSMKSFDTNGISMFVAVSDTGIGIKPEELDRLFTAFDRLDAKRTRTIEGSGLGLSIVHRMLYLMGSNLEVESTYEEGSKFYFTLYQKVADWNRLGAMNMMSYTREAKAGRHKNKIFKAPGARILVVDDTPMNLHVIVGLLKRTEMQIDIATGGEECIARFGEKKYDLVLLDYRMPHMDGIETLNILRERYPEAAHTPIISLTASAVSGDREKMLSAGFTDYLSKPVNIEEMEKMMVRYLPKEKVELVETTVDGDDESKNIPAELKRIELLNPAKGVEFCGDVKEYLNALRIYKNSIKLKSAEMESNLEDISEEKLETYTLLMHSLKSTSNAIGAEAIAGYAMRLEQAGRDGDMAVIRSDTGNLIEMYRSLYEPLDEFFKKESFKEEEELKRIKEEKGGREKKGYTPEGFREELHNIHRLCESRDYMGICEIMDRLDAFKLPEEEKAGFEELRQAVLESDWGRMERCTEFI